MNIKVSLEHRTTYHFDRPVGIGPHIVRLRPAPHSRTPDRVLLADRQPRQITSSTGSRTRSATIWPGWCFPKKADKLEITVGLVADMGVINPFDFFIEEYAERYPFTYPAALAADLEPYLATVEDTPGAGPDL